uniref:PUB domain-containing protein n=1 Tax=Spongospora subterranea TaxID=70186 RepID=A0A0H5RAD2_9EUKA|eukprot:CRZ05389.1 hypothetical protein [Spongospora subterranea]
MAIVTPSRVMTMATPDLHPIIISISNLPLNTPLCLLDLFINECVSRDLDPDRYCMQWQHNDHIIPLYCNVKLQHHDIILLPKSTSVYSRQCRLAIESTDGRIEGTCTTKQTLWDILCQNNKASLIIDDKVNLPVIRIDGGTTITTPRTLMYSTLEAIGLGTVSSIVLHITHIESSISVKELSVQQMTVSKYRHKNCSRTEPVPVGQNTIEVDENIDGSAFDLANFRTTLELKSGSIDRYLSSLCREVSSFADLKTGLRTLGFITQNIIKNPDDARFRTLNNSNLVLKDQVLQYSSAVKLLQCIGFANVDEGLMMPDAFDVSILECALSFIQKYRNRPEKHKPLFPLMGNSDQHVATAGQDPTQPATFVGPVERNLTIYDESLGVDQNPQLLGRDEEFSENSTSDLQLLSAAMKGLHRKSQYAEVLVSKTYVQNQLRSSHPVPTIANIRVRIPPNIIVQGTFGAQDSVGDVYDMVRSVLKCPEMEFRLVLPPATVLSEMASTLVSVGMAPAAVVYASFPVASPAADVLTPDALSKAQRLQVQQNSDDRSQPADKAAPSQEKTPMLSRKSRSKAGAPSWFKG